MGMLESAVTLPPLWGRVRGSSNEPSPLLVHNLGWSSSASCQSPARRTCSKGFAETGSDVGEGMATRGHGSRLLLPGRHSDKLCEDQEASCPRVSNRQAAKVGGRGPMERAPRGIRSPKRLFRRQSANSRASKRNLPLGSRRVHDALKPIKLSFEWR
ncbi:hypothetical protein AUEXF2481DRAFT_283029 [Aureobasidium subglaciale EXF-2481]|uniref:Uncharacterized protein n=1 Tax=Aureobasidium subglaciale (strain EXF-2481) TaxID=1043005 RepID=A0A074YKC8_AURSE|nr:uncharacterized protein AUEXF2481DRAFT_283029 [Aureobasidium subglaciale EXF-2481]KEQ94537.1 hypothetical protein AUEXF2481DRAFT_283029 [Aureobasidium subglaciale EXF-2481]